MPKRRYEQREPMHDWQQLRPLLKDSAQITYEVIRPVILGWGTPKERSAETGMSMRSMKLVNALPSERVWPSNMSSCPES